MEAPEPEWDRDTVVASSQQQPDVVDTLRNVDFESKYRDYESAQLALAYRELELQLFRVSETVLTDHFRTGQFERVVLESGQPWDPGVRPQGWAEQVRGVALPDGRQEMRIAGFEQSKEERTKLLATEYSWIGARLYELGAVGLLKNVPSPFDLEHR